VGVCAGGVCAVVACSVVTFSTPPATMRASSAQTATLPRRAFLQLGGGSNFGCSGAVIVLPY
jgi:hypothetical protein